MTDRTACRTPNPEKLGITNIPTWKFDACRTALLVALEKGPLPAKTIAKAAGAYLSDTDRAALGSLGWHMTTVRLELEMRGEIERMPGVKPLTLRSVG
ncbi:MAG: hypothetical protein AAFY65_09230 [Pseudomonadota bacterium]